LAKPNFTRRWGISLSRKGTPSVFAYGEDAYALRLVSELPDFQAGYVNRFPCTECFGNPMQSESDASKPTKKHPSYEGCVGLRRVDKKDATLKMVKNLVL